jgi:molybdopterin molybdotransferase
VRSSDTLGAADYNPLELTLVERQATLSELPANAAVQIVSGELLLRGADAVLPIESFRVSAPILEVFAPVAEGRGVVRAGQWVQSGKRLLQPRQMLLPQHMALLSSLGIDRVRVLAPPRVRLLVFGPKAAGQRDANGPQLRALVERDGGSVAEFKLLDAYEPDATATALQGAAELTLIAGRSGLGADDIAAQCIARAGALSIHGIAMRPGGSAGLGMVDDTPLVLLPGDPLACWCAYEMLAGALLRRFAGLDPRLPYAVAEAEVARKIVSAIGVADLCRVVLRQGKIEVIGAADSGGIASAARADGFVVVPAALEGYAPGARVTVYLYSEAGRSGQHGSEQHGSEQHGDKD